MNMMEYIKNRVENLYRTNPSVHVTVNRTHPKITVESSSAIIVGVYKNIFQLEERNGRKHPIRYTFQYGDLLTGQIVIDELGDTP